MNKLYLIRHGETEWSLSGQHTGLTDIPLTENGRKQAEQAKALLQDAPPFEAVYTSPLQRAKDTCIIAGYGETAIESDGLLEWNYGEYEGRTSKDIRATRPDWNVFLHGAPGGESPEDVIKRVEAILAQASQHEGNVAFFSSGHILRALTAVYCKQPLELGKHLLLSTASLSILCKDRGTNAIELWNYTGREHG